MAIDSAPQMPLDRLSAHVLETSYNDLDENVLRNCKLRLVDVIGCALGGANGPGNRALVDLVKDWGGKQEATIAGWGDRVPVANAAMVNSILARSYDFEVMSPVIDGKNVPGHVAGTTVMTALAVGEAMAITGKELGHRPGVGR